MSAAPEEPDCASAKLGANWLAEEFARAEAEVAAWPPGLRASFEATHGPIAPPGPTLGDECRCGRGGFGCCEDT